jgi:hypothetical protein
MRHRVLHGDVRHRTVLVADGQAHVAIGDDADDGPSDIDDRHEAASVFVHDLRGIGHGVVRRAGGGRILHQFSNQHRILQMRCPRAI